MNCFDHSFDLPEENLALDEVLLNRAESGQAGEGGEALRFWESPAPFVVVGVAQQIEREVWVEHCRADSVSLQRRCTAGGCVLQGRGSLNYSLVLDLNARPELRGLHESYRAILGRICAALRTAGVDAAHAGTSDLAIDGRKISGNAQRRRKRFILHHGTLLYRFDAALLARYVKEPSDRPAYRGDREHDAFVRNLPLSREAIRECIRIAFGGTESQSPPNEHTLEASQRLAESKYSDPAWIFRR